MHAKSRILLIGVIVLSGACSPAQREHETAPVSGNDPQDLGGYYWGVSDPEGRLAVGWLFFVDAVAGGWVYSPPAALPICISTHSQGQDLTFSTPPLRGWSQFRVTLNLAFPPETRVEQLFWGRGVTEKLAEYHLDIRSVDHDSSAPRGVYSSLERHPESGDFVGVEVVVLSSGDSLVALLTAPEFGILLPSVFAVSLSNDSLVLSREAAGRLRGSFDPATRSLFISGSPPVVPEDFEDRLPWIGQIGAVMSERAARVICP